MRAYLAKLKADAAEANRQRDIADAKLQGADARVLCDKPLRDQIQELMLSLPSAQRNRPWSMDDLVARLQGRFSARPHAMNVGSALRQLGWHSTRDWTNAGAGRRYWHQG
jgi:hypothetical protein